MSVLVKSPKIVMAEIALLILVIAMMTRINGNRFTPGEPEDRCFETYTLSATWRPSPTSFELIVGYIIGSDSEHVYSLKRSPWNRTMKVPCGEKVSMRITQWKTDDLRMDCVIHRNNAVVHSNHRNEMGTVRCYGFKRPGWQIIPKN